MDSMLRFAGAMVKQGNTADARAIYATALRSPEEHWQCAAIARLGQNRRRGSGRRHSALAQKRTPHGPHHRATGLAPNRRVRIRRPTLHITFTILSIAIFVCTSEGETP